MYEKLEHCPSCNHPKFDNYLICKDHAVSGESFALVKCDKCELVFTNPRPQLETLDNYYESEAYISHTDKANSLINVLYKLVRTFTLDRKRKLIRKYSNVGTVLDFGCGTGDFLKSCEESRWITSGLEPNESARQIASGKIKGKLVSELDELEKEDKFDIVTAWHVIEHVSDLKETLKKLRKKIKKGGHLIVAVPNINSADSDHYKDFWAAYDVPRHLYHFSKDSFKTLTKSLKFDLVNIHPMKFDAYYVSLLSEKYKTGKGQLVRGLLNGWKSNVAAARTGEYSSLIFVLKR